MILHDPFELDDTNERKDAQVFLDLLVRRSQEELQREQKSVSKFTAVVHTS